MFIIKVFPTEGVFVFGGRDPTYLLDKNVDDDDDSCEG